jgi:hypothetical protein
MFRLFLCSFHWVGTTIGILLGSFYVISNEWVLLLSRLSEIVTINLLNQPFSIRGKKKKKTCKFGLIKFQSKRQFLNSSYFGSSAEILLPRGGCHHFGKSFIYKLLLNMRFNYF